MSGLEYVDLAVALADSVLNLTQFLVEGLGNAKDYGPGFEESRLAISLEAETFKAIKSVLFGTTGSTSSGLFVNFDMQAQLNIISTLRRFQESLESHYQLVTRVYSSTGPGILDVTDTARPFGSFHSTSIFRRLRWGFADKSRFEKMSTQLHCWNEKLFRIVQLKSTESTLCQANSNLLPQAPSSFLAKLQESQVVGEIEALGLPSDIKLAKMSISAAVDGGRSSTPTQLLITNSQPYEKAPVWHKTSDRRIVQLDNKDVLLEYKDYNADGAGNPPRASRDRVNQLAKILHTQKPDRYRTLHCDGFYFNSAQFVLAFALPHHLAPRYMTLHERLQTSVPDLEVRFALARQLCTALFQLHTVGWVHKSFRSSNIMFFASRSSPEQTPALDNMYLSGWEYSRPELEFSSGLPDRDSIGENVYRHPDQWGLPTVRFNRTHDVYALGVVLLEIGRWKKALSFHHNKFRGSELGSVVKTCLVGAASDQKLRSSMGSRYQTLVLKCLQGSFDTRSLETDPAQLEAANGAPGSLGLKSFEKEVIDVLDEIICHL